MSALSDRLEFMLETNSQREVSRLTGIPQSTISYVSRGLRDVPDKYSQALRNAYQKDAYQRLYSLVPNSTNANRFKWYSPNTVKSVLAKTDKMINDYTQGAIVGHFANFESEPTEDEIRTAIPGFRHAVIEGLGKSKYSYEDWLDYPSKNTRKT